jgi:ketosteroid isomerase-like protein
MTTQAHSNPSRQLADAEEIRRLIAEYAFHLDMNHPAQLVDLFVEDCEVVYGPGFGAQGKTAYAKTLEGIGTFFQATSHHVSNVVIDFVSENEAHVRTILYAWHRYTRERPDGHLWGQYHDIIVRESTQWKFKRRELRTTGVKDFHVKTMLPIGRS